VIKWKVITSVNVTDVTTIETVNVDATDHDAACGSAIGILNGIFGDDADIHVQKILRQDAGNTAVMV
jgi:hypothetical protein